MILVIFFLACTQWMNQHSCSRNVNKTKTKKKEFENKQSILLPQTDKIWESESKFSSFFLLIHLFCLVDSETTKMNYLSRSPNRTHNQMCRDFLFFSVRVSLIPDHSHSVILLLFLLRLAKLIIIREFIHKPTNTQTHTYSGYQGKKIPTIRK